jgi:hypothetical protein
MVKIKDDKTGRACSRCVKMRNTYKIWSENIKGRDHMEDIDMDGRIMLKWIFRK